MAFADTSRGRQLPLTERTVAWFGQLGQSWQRYRLYRRTLDELSGLSNRELADLGLSRSGIRAIAYDAAYGQR